MIVHTKTFKTTSGIFQMKQIPIKPVRLLFVITQSEKKILFALRSFDLGYSRIRKLDVFSGHFSAVY